jgi:hypothetical protein
MTVLEGMLCCACRAGWQAAISLFAAPAPYLLDSCTTWAAADATKASQAAFVRVRLLFNSTLHAPARI